MGSPVVWAVDAVERAHNNAEARASATKGTRVRFVFIARDYAVWIENVIRVSCGYVGLHRNQGGTNGRDRDRTDDLHRVKVALIPTELRARKAKGAVDTIRLAGWGVNRVGTEGSAAEPSIRGSPSSGPA